MRIRPAALALAAAFVLAALPARACLWDSDTIAEERSRFPTAMEILAGKYNKHSVAFYEWRIKDRRKKLEKDPDNLALLDDLGVALVKTGKFQEAVAVGERAVALNTKRYESQSNLGTYYIFAGDLDKSVQHIKAALAINPEAHFGRERYQLYLVEYMQTAQRIKGKAFLPLRDCWPEYDGAAYKALGADDQKKVGDFSGDGYRFFIDTTGSPERRKENLDKGTKGVLGMMRFANDELPVLNEAAGDLLNTRQTNQIAARAYLKASYHAPDESAKKAYRLLAGHAVHMQTNIKLDELESDFKDELAQGQAWQAQIAADEAHWIAEGKDPEKEYDLKYREDNEPSLWLNPSAVARQFFRGWFTGHMAPFGWGSLLVVALVALYIRGVLKRRKAGAASPPPKHRSFWLTK